MRHDVAEEVEQSCANHIVYESLLLLAVCCTDCTDCTEAIPCRETIVSSGGTVVQSLFCLVAEAHLLAV